MKVLLVFPPRRLDSYIFPPTSLLYVAQAIRSAGYEAKIIDVPYLLQRFPEKYSLLDESLFNYILQQDFDVLGLGGVVSTYFFYEDFVKRVRKVKGNIPIVVGGSVGAPIRDVWLKYAPVDFLVYGDGENAIKRLLNHLEGKESIENVPGLYYLKDGDYKFNLPEIISDLDSINFLSYDELDYEYYIRELTRWVQDNLSDTSFIKTNRLRLLPLLTSRGCPFSCNFCFHFNNTHRYHSIEYVIEYIKLLKKKYDINSLYIIDDLFIFNRKRTIELCESIYKANLNLYLVGSGGKPSFVDREMLESMKKAGFIRFSYGIESGSQKMLDIMQKKTTVEQNFNALKMTEGVGIPAFANIIFGMLGENSQTLEETKKFLIRANLNTKRFYGAWATAYPGTPLFENLKSRKIITNTRDYLLRVGSIGKYVCNLTDLPIDELKKKVYEINNSVDLAYFYNNKLYKKYIMKLTQIILVKMFNLFFARDRKVRDKVKNLLSNLSKNKQKEQSKNNIKRSYEDIEEWVQRTYTESLNNKCSKI